MWISANGPIGCVLSAAQGKRAHMTDISETNAPTEPSIWNTRTFYAAGVLAALVIIGDVLMWYHSSGVNILVFFIAVIAAIAALHPRKLGDARTIVLILVALLGVAPFFETLSPWALLTAQGGI